MCLQGWWYNPIYMYIEEHTYNTLARWSTGFQWEKIQSKIFSGTSWEDIGKVFV